jgi:hypothetical protein
MSMAMSHRNSINSIQQSAENAKFNKSFFMYFQYKTMQTTEEIEAYVYDTVSFLAATGGNLGLLLGFSCLSILLTLFEKLSTRKVLFFN